jgi:uncharacterized protein
MSFRKKLFVILPITLAIAGGTWAVLAFRKDKAAEVCFESSRCFFVEIAKTPAVQEKGLMFRESLPQDQGMLFVFMQEGIYNFWMKNTLIPLDMIWINENREVIFIKNDAQPCTENFCSEIVPDGAAKYVLEINAGKAKELGIFVGQKISISE